MSYHHTRFLAFVLCLVCLLATSAAATTGTLVLKSGERYENLDFKVDQAYKVVKYEVDGKKKATSFADIEAIYDSAGSDITLMTLRGEYRKPEEQKRDEWLEAKSEVYRKANAKPWHFAMRFGGNFTVPVSDYYEGITSGVGFGGDVILPINSTFALRGSISLAGSRIDDDFVALGSGFELISNDLDIDAWRYLFGLEYYSPYGRGHYDKGHWFLFTGLGATSHKFSGTALLRERSSGDLYEMYGTGGETKFTLNTMVGGVSMFSRWGGIEYSASFDLLFIGTARDYDGYSQMQNAGNFDLRAGLVVVFPTKQDNNE